VSSEAKVALHSSFVGNSGPVHISYPKEYSASHYLWHGTLNTLGVKSNESHLAGTNIGCWTSVCSIDPVMATRSYAANSYYLPMSFKSNLVVLTGAEVNEILFTKDPSAGGWCAEGVRFYHQGSEFTALASREVIISAGSVQSPCLLEKSGIGCSSILTAAGIPVKIDNPNVGENLQDHLSKFNGRYEDMNVV
jgi:choline dehydrogenase-like flavoprotein